MARFADSDNDEDLGRSGSSSERRTGWQRLQIMIAAKQVGAVFVANISRLSRQVLEFELFRILAAAHNTLLHTDGRLVDSADSNDTMLSQMTAMMAHFENRKRSEIMSQARKTKAKQGAVMSALPIGWIKNPDGKYDFDPETKDTIRMIIEAFWQTQSLRRTVRALEKAGIQIPSRHGQRICFKKPTYSRVSKILTNPAYAGIYVYGRTQSQPGGPILANGESKRIKVPEERWIKTLNHHPAYMSQEQQEEIKTILKNNRFQRRHRAGRGPALTQGLLRCARCKGTLNVKYLRYRSYGYQCVWVVEACTRFTSYEFDRHVVAEVFKVLESPPLDMLRAVLEETRSQERARLKWIGSERERLAHEECIAQERAELTRGSLPRVHLDALVKLEKVLEEKERFEQKIVISSLVPKQAKSEEELEELCRLASEVPSLWEHESVTHQERKEILRCIIDPIVVAATKERIDATIFWKSGSQTPLSMWRGPGRHKLICELYAQDLTVREIREHLAAGKTSTGQVIQISRNKLRFVLHKLGLKPNRYSAGYVSLRQKAAELNREGRSLDWIAQYFNERGFASARGKFWNRKMVEGLLHTLGEKPESLENIHRRAITEALARGLSYRQMAIEFNEKKLRRRKNNRQPWTAHNAANTWSKLNRRERNREQKGSTNTELSESAALKKSA